MENKNQSGFKKIDTLVYERWFHRIVSHWHLFLVSIGIAYAGSYFYLKYTKTVYSVAASVLVKDASGSINPFKAEGFDYSTYARNINLTNEIKIFSSRKLMEETLKNIDWEVSYFVEGTIKVTEIYKFNSFKITFSDSNNIVPYGKLFLIKISPGNKFELSLKDDNTTKYDFQKFYQFNTTYNLNGFIFEVRTPNEFVPQEGLYSFKINKKESILDEFGSKIRVAQFDKSSSVLSISSNGSCVEREIDFINNHCNTFVKLSLNDKNATNERAIGFIEKQLVSIADTLVTLESNLSYYRKRFSGSDIEDMISKRFSKLETLEEEKAKIELKNKYFEYLKDYIQSRSEYTDMIVPISIGVDNTELNAILTQLMELKSKQNVSFKIEQTQSPFRIENETKINQLKRSLDEVIKTIEMTNKMLIDDLNKRISLVSNVTGNILDSERNFIDLKRKYKINEELYNILLKKKAEMSIVRAGNISDTKIVDYASVTGAPYPNISKIYSTNIIIALLIPLAYVLFKYLTNYRIMERDDVTNVCDMPFLGTIGHIPDNDNMVILNKPKSALSESFRSIRANLTFFMPREDQNTILITSSLSGDGKTFTSLNIASIIAISGKKIVLIGADMRKPKVYLDIDTKGQEGLSSYLINKSTVEKIIRTTKVENLYFISSGPVPPNPAELLMNNKMDELMKYLKEKFDYIIIDTPPIGLVSDAMTLMKYSDVNIFVVRHDYSQSRYLRELGEHIAGGKINNMTFILNDFDVRKNYGYGYRYGYGYYGSEYGGGYGYTYGGSSYGYYEEEKSKKTWISKLRKWLRME
jgi:capsular exopolysaccharide synthesis family protein